MNKLILAALATLTAGTMMSTVVASNATPLMRSVQCADGTVFKLGDEITDEIACADHGGVSNTTVVTPSQLQTNSGIDPIPLKPKTTFKRVSKNIAKR
ncbi:hypothetical protein [Lentilitoribacter sp. Alg239-R112]|uniref:hypothetical protein n=1 Tax=Lentilitoribacter sp. Alg239-R112 TaxID=2305987 RepID=UPI0013A6FE76|nr:hypothetical protein [Lentilitoribacter sp. Alg239-R112]